MAFKPLALDGPDNSEEKRDIDMGKFFETQWECRECFETSENRSVVHACHGDSGRIYVCEVCNRDHNTPDAAQRCHSDVPSGVTPLPPQPAVEPKPFKPDKAARRRIAKGSAPKSNIVLFQTLSKTSLLADKPDPNCPVCGVSQALGEVVYCRCMKRELPPAA